MNPYFWVNHNQLGEAYLHFGDTEKSLEEFRRVTELEPKNPVGYNNIGSAYFARGEWEKGIPAYEQSLKLQPHWLTYSSLGTAYFYLKRYPDAVKAFEQAAALNPNDAITMGNLADGLRWSGERDRALNVYATAISLAYKDLQVNPKDATTLAMVGLYQAKSGNDGRRDGVHQKSPRGRPVECGASLLRGRGAHAGRPHAMPRWRRCRRRSTAAIQPGRRPKTPSWRCSRSLRPSRACCTADGAVSPGAGPVQRVDLRRRLEMSAAPNPSPVPSSSKLAGSGVSVDERQHVMCGAGGEPDQVDGEVAADADDLDFAGAETPSAIPPPAKCAPNCRRCGVVHRPSGSSARIEIAAGIAER